MFFPSVYNGVDFTGVMVAEVLSLSTWYVLEPFKSSLDEDEEGGIISPQKIVMKEMEKMEKMKKEMNNCSIWYMVW